jgi:hypothetical protein
MFFCIRLELTGNMVLRKGQAVSLLPELWKPLDCAESTAHEIFLFGTQKASPMKGLL